MARRSREIKELQDRIRALPLDDQAEVIKGVLTSRVRFSLAVERIWKKQAKQSLTGIDKALQAARREAEREHQDRRPKRGSKRAS